MGQGYRRWRPRAAGRVVRGCTWYDRPGPVRGCARSKCPAGSGPGSHCRRDAPAGSVLPTPTRDRTRNYLGRRSRGRERTSTRGWSESGIPDPAHEPNNWVFGQQAWWTVGTAALICSSFFSDVNALRYRGAFSRPAHGARSAAPWRRQAVRPGRSGVGRARRRTPRPSRSDWTTRAAATRSGSRVTVPASQSTYEGSNAAI